MDSIAYRGWCWSVIALPEFSDYVEFIWSIMKVLLNARTVRYSEKSESKPATSILREHSNECAAVIAMRGNPLTRASSVFARGNGNRLAQW